MRACIRPRALLLSARPLRALQAPRRGAPPSAPAADGAPPPPGRRPWAPPRPLRPCSAAARTPPPANAHAREQPHRPLPRCQEAGPPRRPVAGHSPGQSLSSPPPSPAPTRPRPPHRPASSCSGRRLRPMRLCRTSMTLTGPRTCPRRCVQAHAALMRAPLCRAWGGCAASRNAHPGRPAWPGDVAASSRASRRMQPRAVGGSGTRRS
jgi:hypothetical protein